MKTFNNQYIGQKGAAAVEFAIVLPLLITLIFGIVEFSILFYNKAMITNASREGARAGIVLLDSGLSDLDGDGDVDDDDRILLITDTIDTYCSNNLITFGSGGTSPTVNITLGAGAGDPLTVTVNYNYEFLLLPNFIGAIGDVLNLSAVTVMRME